MEPIVQAKYKFIRIQLLVIICMGGLAFVIHFSIFNLLWEGLWNVLLLALELLIGGLTIWQVFQFYQPKKTFSFNPIFILISLTFIYGGSFYALSSYLTCVDHESLYPMGWPIHFAALFFLYYIFFYEWWFLKNELRNDYNLQRLLHLQDDLKNAEIRNIQQNVQPHFLYNSLNSINSLMLIDVEEAQKMVVQLSDFLRYSVIKGQEMYTLIQDEILQLERYFSIEKIRFNSRLDYRIQVSPGLEKHKIPSMLLQPLLENAIKHGLYGQIEKCEITISFEEDAESVFLRVSNNFDSEAVAKAGTGFGIKGLKQKLYWLYGDVNLLKIHTDASHFNVEIRLPKRRNENPNN